MIHKKSIIVCVITVLAGIIAGCLFYSASYNGAAVRADDPAVLADIIPETDDTDAEVFFSDAEIENEEEEEDLNIEDIGETQEAESESETEEVQNEGSLLDTVEERETEPEEETEEESEEEPLIDMILSEEGTLPLFSDNVYYLDGVDGDDDNDGLTPETAWKTFAKVRSANAYRNASIVIINTVTITGTEEWLGSTNSSYETYIHRGFSGLMIKVESGGALALRNLTIDGYNVVDDDADAEDTMIEVEKGASLNIGRAGYTGSSVRYCTLQNNHNRGSHTTAAGQGGGDDRDIDFTAYGGAIRCFAGGTINIDGTSPDADKMITYEDTVEGKTYTYDSGSTTEKHVSILNNSCAWEENGEIVGGVGGAVFVATYSGHGVGGMEEAPDWGIGAKVTLTNVIIQGNRSRNGGGVYIGNFADVPQILGCVVEDNHAIDAVDNQQIGGRDGGTGGGLRISSSNDIAKINFNTIRENTATGDGGGIFVRAGDDEINVSGYVYQISQNDISNNSSGNGGGGLYLELGEEGRFGISMSESAYEAGRTFWNNTFSENTAVYGGGFYVIFQSGFTSTYNEFTNNNAEIEGGGFYTETISESQDVYLSVNQNVVNGNYAGENGGGISCRGSLYLIGYSERVEISGNSCENNGGGIYMPYGYIFFSYVRLGASEPDESLVGQTREAILAGGGNWAGENGGGLYMESGAISFQMAQVYNNTAAAGSGGGAYIKVTEDSELATGPNTITNVIFQYNNAKIDGGGVYFSAEASASIERLLSSTYKDNIAGKNGGGLWINYESDAETVISSSYNTFSGNKAIQGGGIFLTGTKSLRIERDTFSDNYAHRGGGIYVDGGSFRMAASDYTKEMQEYYEANPAERPPDYSTSGYSNSPTITGNYATAWDGDTEDGKGYDGGGIYVYGEETELYIHFGKITQNEADGDGGGIYVDGAGIDISEYKNDSASLIFSDNKAGNSGGGLYFGRGKLHLEDVAIENNTAVAGDGGGMYLRIGTEAEDGKVIDSNITEEIINTTISENEAGRNGGGLVIEILANGVSNDISDNTVKDNVAGQDGGGAYVVYDGRGDKISGNLIDNNTAGRNGGGFYVSREDLRYRFGITTDTLINNTAGQDGGGIYLENCFMTVVFNAGLVYLTAGQYPASAEVVMNNPSVYENAIPLIEGNTAGRNGGGIFADGSSRVKVEYGIIRGNTAINGGGIYSSYNREGFLADEAELAMHDPSAEGDEYYWTKQFSRRLLDIYDVRLEGNNAVYGSSTEKEDGNGGAIYLENQQHQYMFLQRTVFEENNADRDFVWNMDPSAISGYSYYHQTQILESAYTAGYQNAYNNYDINMDYVFRFRKVDEESISLIEQYENSLEGTDELFGWHWQEATMIEGAEFTLYQYKERVTDLNQFSGQLDLDDGEWEVWGAPVTSESYGIVSYIGMDDSYTYLLAETKAAPGYEISARFWLINLKDDLTVDLMVYGRDGTGKLYPVPASLDKAVEYWLAETQAYVLPETGGNGRQICLLAGVLFMLMGTTSLLWYQKKQQFDSS